MREYPLKVKPSHNWHQYRLLSFDTGWIEKFSIKQISASLGLTSVHSLRVHQRGNSEHSPLVCFYSR
jgi:hypothetical protein